jgi:hypothetical protein
MFELLELDLAAEKRRDMGDKKGATQSINLKSHKNFNDEEGDDMSAVANMRQQNVMIRDGFNIPVREANLQKVG